MIKHSFYVIAFVLFASVGFAQTGVQLSPANHDRNAKVVALGDNVSVDLETNIGTFEGNARISQGELRISADKIILSYDEEDNSVADVQASGSIIFTNGEETAEAQTAHFNAKSNIIVLSGDVLLVQGSAVISGDTMRLDLTTNRAVVSGNVKTVFQPNEQPSEQPSE